MNAIQLLKISLLFLRNLHLIVLAFQGRQVAIAPYPAEKCFDTIPSPKKGRNSLMKEGAIAGMPCMLAFVAISYPVERLPQTLPLSLNPLELAPGVEIVTSMVLMLTLIGFFVAQKIGIRWTTVAVIDDNKACLCDSEQRYQSLIANIPGAVYRCIKTNPWTLEVISEHIDQITGYPATDFINNQQRSYESIIYEQDREQVNTELAQAINHNSAYILEYRIVAADGSLRWVCDRGRGIYAETGELLRLDGVLFDITESKQVEAALRKSEARFRRLFDSNIIGVIFSDVNGNINEANDAYLQMVGYSREQLLDGQLCWTAMTPPEYWPTSDQKVQEILDVGSCRPFEKEHIRQDGSRVPILIAAARLESSADVVAFVLDLTERKRVEAERDRLLQLEQAARAEAETANQLKDEFLAVLSHEIRSPLNPILGWARLLQTREFDPPSMRQALEIIERNARLQMQLIEDLLDVSRILRGKLQIEPYVVELGFVADAALETVKLLADAKSIQLTVEITPHLKILGDASRLQQVVSNLLANAVKFTPHGGEITVRVGAVGSQGHIVVQDSGIGIQPDFLPHVFDYFRQADSTTTRKFGGLGLGLAIARQLVELHHGEIWASSPGEGAGATFTVSLPLLRTEAQPAPVGQSPDVPLNLAGVKVLIAEDVVDTLELLVWILEQYGAQVTAVTSAEAALAALSQAEFDVLVSDIGMPGMDGYQLIHQIRKLKPEQGRKLPAIALSAYVTEADQQRAIAAGFNRHLPKPVEPADLVTTVAIMVRKPMDRLP